jgi:hypothetical protein
VEHTQPNFIDNLIALRDHYQSLLADYASKSTHAREQLSHINALLVDQLVASPTQATAPLSAVIQEPSATLALTGATETPHESPATALSEFPAGVSAASNGKKPRKQTTRRLTTRKKASSDQGNKEPEITSLALEPKPIQPTAQRKGNRPETKLPLLPAYAGLSKIEAIAKVIQDNAGKVVHIDQLINSLVGELSGADLIAERGRMRNTLNRGAKNGQWVKLKDRELSYTLDSKLLKSTPAAKPEAQPENQLTAKNRSRSKVLAKSVQKSLLPSQETPANDLDFRPQYVGKSLSESVENVMQAHRGQAMTSDSVAKVLFGDIDGATLAKIKKQLNGVFSRGVSQQRWKQVKGQRGVYIMA